MFYETVRMIIRFIFTLFFRWKREGMENIPKIGGAVVATNHISNFDPPVVGCAIRRPIYFMAKEELFKLPILGFIISRLKAFPVKRGGADRGAIRKAMEIVEQGELLGVFPEGTRSKTGQLQKGQPGFVMIAAKGKVPIIPAAVINTNKIFSNGTIFPQIIVRYGKPIMPDYPDKLDKEFTVTLTEQVMAEIAKLLEKE